MKDAYKDNKDHCEMCQSERPLQYYYFSHKVIRAESRNLDRNAFQFGSMFVLWFASLLKYMNKSKIGTNV